MDSQVDDGAVLAEQRLQLVLGRVVWNVAQEQLVVVAKLLRSAILAAIISVVLVAATGVARSTILLLPEWSLAAWRAIAADGSLLVGATSLGQRSSTESSLLVLLTLLGRLTVVLVATTHRSAGVTRLKTRWWRRKTCLASCRDIVVALLLLVVLLLLLLLGLLLLLVRRLLLLLMVGRHGGEAQRTRSTGTARLDQVGVRFRFIWRLLLLLLVTQMAMVVGVACLGRSRIVHGR